MGQTSEARRRAKRTAASKLEAAMAKRTVRLLAVVMTNDESRFENKALSSINGAGPDGSRVILVSTPHSSRWDAVSTGKCTALVMATGIVAKPRITAPPFMVLAELLLLIRMYVTEVLK
jgi:hypothetical protein